LVAKVKYEPIGDVLSPQTAFLQASLYLDLAAQIAVENRDVEGLIGCSATYAEIATRLMGPGPHEEDEEEDIGPSAAKNPLGFGPAVIPAPPEEQEASEIEEGEVDE
jgi:hypothetical protein